MMLILSSDTKIQKYTHYRYKAYKKVPLSLYRPGQALRVTGC